MPQSEGPFETYIGASRRTVFEPFCLLHDRRLLLEGEKPVAIGARALEILIALLERPGELVSKDELFARAWPNTIVEELNLRAQVAALRRALRENRDTRYIAAAPGRGYRFVGLVSAPGGEDIGLPEAGHSPERPKNCRNNLPSRLTPIIGRAEVIGVLSARLKRRRFVTIVGPAGIGKTTVALAVATELSSAYADGAYFVDLAPLADAELVASAVAAAFGAAPVTEDPVSELVAFVRGKHILLLLDSCEHVVEAAAILTERMLKGALSVDVLATSREPLRAEGESVHRLAPLTVPPVQAGQSAADALGYSSVELFVERAASIADDFELTNEEAPIVADLCRQLDGIALAIELAAARVDALHPRAIAARLNDRFRLLTGGRRTALPRHRTLAAALNWSYELLTERERAVFRRLAVFAGGFTLEAVSAVCADAEITALDIPDLLAQLIAKSMVIAGSEGARGDYRLLDTMRAYSAAKLAESGQKDAFLRRHAQHFRDVFERALSEWEERSIGEWLASYAWQIDNLRTALEWAYSSKGDADVGMALTVAAIPLWFQLSSTDECRECVERALSRLGSEEARDARAREIMQLYLALGLSRTFTIGVAPQAAAAWAKAFDIAEALNDKEYQLEALWGLWFYHIGAGEYRAALQVAQQFCATAETTPDIRMGDRLVGVPLHCLGDHAAARDRIERLLIADLASPNTSRGVRFRFGQPTAARVILAQMLWLQGFPEMAQNAASTSADEARAMGHAISLCDALAQAVCPIAILTGDLHGADEAVAMLLEHSGRHSLGPWSVLGKAWRAVLLVKRNEFSLGLRLLRDTLDELRQVRFAFHHTGFLAALAEGLAKTREFAQGLKVVEHALTRCDQNEERWYVAELLRMKGEILFLGEAADISVAEKQVMESLDFARRQGALSWELRATTSLSRLRRVQGRADEARGDLQAVYRRFVEGFASADLLAANALIEELS